MDCSRTAEPKVPLSRLRPYWYETGPHTVMDGFVDLKDSNAPANHRPAQPGRNFTILLKREGAHNIFHTFHEMMSLMYSIDMLRLATDPMTGRPYYSEADVANTQIVVLDDHPDGPYWDLWRIWSGRVPKRLHELVEEDGGWLSRPLGHLILPLAGAANPIWHGTWDGVDCTDDLRKDDQLTLTFVDRRQTRRLEGLDDLLGRIRVEHPDVKIEAVDFGAISLREQIDVARKTDILVGVHGAGLTHSLFMKEGRGAVVEIFPPDFQYSGLRAIARERNLRYYKTHSTTRKHEGDWHFEDGAGADIQIVNNSSSTTNRLPSVHIRLHSHISYDEMRTGVNSISRAAPFRFLDLPTEIQLSILHYTDLVTPLSAVIWSPDQGFHLPSIDNEQAWGACHSRVPCGPPYDRCHPFNHLNCTGRLKDPLTGWHARRGSLPEDGRPDDAEPICPCPHASADRPWWLAYRGRCSLCRHYACQFMPSRAGSDTPADADRERLRVWQPPTSLFLVSRYFRETCCAFFFSRNYFHVKWFVDRYPYSIEHAGPVWLSRTVPASAISSIRTLRIDFGDFRSMDRYNGAHLWQYGLKDFPFPKDMSQVDELLDSDPMFTAYTLSLKKTATQLRLDTLVLDNKNMCTFNLHNFGKWHQESWEKIGPQAIVRFVRQVVTSMHWPPLKDAPLSVLGGTGTRHGGQRLIAALNFGSDTGYLPVLYIRRQVDNPIPPSSLLYYLDLEGRPSGDEYATGPHRVSDGEPVGTAEEGSTVVDEVFFGLLFSWFPRK
ncbi:uncharacterized protein PG998_002895 [Apiospora kogelbergensis]|uniref:uncharacterized protein n=1 Tax=Apiospora kogelbergensis TaxID=1337665 RepID=UPI0031303A38